MLRAISLVLLLLSTLPAATAQQEHFWGEELQPILQLINPSGLTASLQLEGRCDPMRLPSFPNFRTGASTGSSTLQAISSIVSTDHGMHVSQDEDGTIRMTEEGVPDDILNVRITHLSFDSYGPKGLYSANEAVRIIMYAPEVVAFLDAHGMQWGANHGYVGGIGIGSREHDGHILKPLENVTVAEAFDRVLDSFRGEALVYWNCPATQKHQDPEPSNTSQVWRPSGKFFLNCSENLAQSARYTSFPANLPDPFCLPPSAFPVLHIPDAEPEPSHQRRVFFRFFSLKKFGDKTIVGSG
jgi:hypothetical protein